MNLPSAHGTAVRIEATVFNKLDDVLARRYERGGLKDQEVALLIVECADGQSKQVRERIEALGGVVKHSLPEYGIFSAELSLDRVVALAAADDVLSVGVEPEYRLASPALYQP